MCCPTGPIFFYVLPLLTPGGIINPPPKTACRDQAHFRRDSVKISTRLHFSVRVHFFPLYFSCFPFFFFLLTGRMYTCRYKIKYSRTVSRADASSLVCAKFLLRFGTPRYYSSLIEIFETGIAEVSRTSLFYEINGTIIDYTISVWSIVPMKCWQMKWNTWKGDFSPFLFFVPLYLFFSFFFFNNDEKLTQGRSDRSIKSGAGIGWDRWLFLNKTLSRIYFKSVETRFRQTPCQQQGRCFSIVIVTLAKNKNRWNCRMT